MERNQSVRYVIETNWNERFVVTKQSYSNSRYWKQQKTLIRIKSLNLPDYSKALAAI